MKVRIRLIEFKVLATGFDLTHYDVDLRGRNGKTREQHWRDYGHKATYKSIAMHGFPNFFYILGPNSGRLHTSTIQIIERYDIPPYVQFNIADRRVSEVEMVIRTIRPIIHHQASSVEVKANCERTYDAMLHEAIHKTVHSNLCGSVSSSSRGFFVQERLILFCDSTLLTRLRKRIGSFTRGTRFTCGYQRIGVFPTIGFIK